MNINAKKGHKVTVTEETINNGYPHHKVFANKYLKVGEVYTVENIHIGDWHTDVEVKEIPDMLFNSVHFIDYTTRKKLKLKVDLAVIDCGIGMLCTYHIFKYWDSEMIEAFIAKMGHNVGNCNWGVFTEEYDYRNVDL